MFTSIPEGIFLVHLGGSSPREEWSNLPERSCLSERASAERTQSFLMGRLAARRALEMLGIKPALIGIGAHREPLWPDGVMGSISHTADQAVAMVGLAKNFTAIGIDVESAARTLDHDISKKVCRPEELTWILRGGILRGGIRHGGPDTERERLLQIFSAKESIYKALYPLYRRFFGYQDASLEWNDGNGCFKATLLFDVNARYPAQSVIDVQVRKKDGLIFTFVALPS